jgi:hypothetical protein
MKPQTLRTILIAALAIALVAVLFTRQSGAFHAAASPLAVAADHESTMNDQTDLAITVYNSNVALVRDTRDVSMPTGDFQLRFMDIASTVNPASVHVRALTNPEKLGVLEQDYEYDLLDAAKMLDKYVGHEVTLLRTVKRDNSTAVEEVKATLLANNAGGPVWKIGDAIQTGLKPDGYRFPALPDNLYSHPTLVWTLNNTGAERQKIEASYLANNVTWSADYVLNIARDDASASLDGWVTLVNNSGTAFKNAKLQLVAGQLNRVNPVLSAFAGAAMDKVMAAAPPMEQENFSEYHLYTLNRRTSVLDKETKQVSMLTAPSFPVVKRYVVNGQPYYFRTRTQPGAAIKNPVQVYYKFKNEEKAGLGMPLPAGTIRAYQADSHGGALFIGEDRIDHTPKDEDVSIHVGDAFDIVAERRQTDYKSLGANMYESEYEITLRNHKDTAITVEVNEPIGGDWEFVGTPSFPGTKTAAFAAQFQVPVAKDGTAVLKYRVRARY